MCLLGLDFASATKTYRQDALTETVWLAGTSRWGWNRHWHWSQRACGDRSPPHCIYRCGSRLSCYAGRWIPRPVLPAAVTLLERAWIHLCRALLTWLEEAIPAHEIEGIHGVLNNRRPRPSRRPERVSPWLQFMRRFASGATRFIDRRLPYATKETYSTMAPGLLGDWKPPGSC